ncbi:H(+)/Cl(-) exchange transporter ClcA [mine drainage metagenome]|uniref:H(+)/Cl(-) exchange transporter ClcA n=1 Tax=mine drainage metagenome TaxID=410659 RepID=A0A1J5NZQ4_9ZZZZ
MKFDPHISAAFKKELADWRLWWARSGVVAAAVVAGLTVVAFTWLTELASTAFFNLRTAWWWAPLLWTPINAAAVVWLTRRFAAGAGGSGIPQVMASLAPDVTETSRDLFVAIRLTIGKFLLTSWALLGGLSLGREGPSVQIAAGVTRSVRR